MIVRPNLTWWKAITAWRGSTLQATWGRQSWTLAVAIAVTVGHESYGLFHINLTTIPFSLIGLALSIFLGFRNNTAYDRFWEGRKLWGAVVNTSRNLTRQTLTLIGPKAAGDAPGDALPAKGAHLTDAQREFQAQQVRRIAAYVHLLRLHLRDEHNHQELSHLIDPAEVTAMESEHNRPIAALQILGDDFRRAWDAGWVHDLHLPVFEQSLAKFADLQGGCERIKATPIPFSYTVLIHRIVGVYCVGLPFGLVDTIGVLTPVVVGLVSYAFYGLDAVGDQIEEPFGHDDNDLPLSTLTRMIEVDVRRRIGDEPLPPLLKPVNKLLQ
ncbi:MAG: hypothetical protein KC502_12425 [Myxococcales bacterium]|nr:hypothetical protein [Myxococcales bacterium]